MLAFKITKKSIQFNVVSYPGMNVKGLASSRQREFHPKPLTEPYVIVSHHTALVIQIYEIKLNSQPANGKTNMEIVPLFV